MQTRSDGGPAFPNTVRIDNEEFASLRGMTLRDYFAAKAMQGMLACSLIHEAMAKGSAPIVGTITASAYEFADAMLAERAK